MLGAIIYQTLVHRCSVIRSGQKPQATKCIIIIISCESAESEEPCDIVTQWSADHAEGPGLIPGLAEHTHAEQPWTNCEQFCRSRID